MIPYSRFPLRGSVRSSADARGLLCCGALSAIMARFYKDISTVASTPLVNPAGHGVLLMSVAGELVLGSFLGQRDHFPVK